MRPILSRQKIVRDELALPDWVPFLFAAFDPGEKRDDKGRWTTGGAGGPLKDTELWRTDEGALYLSRDEGNAAESAWYGSENYKNTNAYLRKGKLPSYLDEDPAAPWLHKDRFIEDIDAFQAAIMRSPAFTRDALAYRGVRGNGPFGKPGTAKGKTFTDKGFVSVTSDSSIAAEYGQKSSGMPDTVILVQIPQGAHALKSAPPGSNDPAASETQEYTLPAGTHFAVTSDVPGESSTGTPRKIIVMVMPNG